MAWCEAHHVDYVLGMARNPLLEKIVAGLWNKHVSNGNSQQNSSWRSNSQTVSGTWSRRRRVIAKAEYTGGKSNHALL